MSILVALPDLDTRVRVACGNRVVDVDKEARVGVGVGARQSHSRARSGGAAAACDGDLGAGDLGRELVDMMMMVVDGGTHVELSTVLAGGGVDGDVLGAEEVVAVCLVWH